MFPAFRIQMRVKRQLGDNGIEWQLNNVRIGERAMRVCGRFPNSPARARQLYWGWSTFAPPPTAGSCRVRITCGNVPGAPSTAAPPNSATLVLPSARLGHENISWQKVGSFLSWPATTCACAGVSKLSCARATTVLGLEHFRATADGGVLPCQDDLRECSGRAVYRRDPQMAQRRCCRPQG
jgi:hypothetical protein